MVTRCFKERDARSTGSDYDRRHAQLVTRRAAHGRAAMVLGAAALLSAAGLSSVAHAQAQGSETRAFTETRAFPVAADGHVSRVSPRRNFGRASRIVIDGSPVHRGFLAFRVDGLPGPVVSAALVMRSSSRSRAGYSVRLTRRAWDERRLNYRNAPALSRTVAVSGRLEKGWNATDLKAGVPGEGTVRLALNTRSREGIRIFSRESGSGATLLVTTAVSPIAVDPPTLPPALVTEPPPETPSDTAALETSISSGPSGLTRLAAPEFGFSASESGSAFECRLEGPGSGPGVWGSCSSPKGYAALADGAYTFSVRATDPAGNPDPSPATRSFTVDAAVPDTSISSGPSGLTPLAAPEFGFSASESGSTFECRLDAGAWQSCSSPKGYTGLADGAYTFSVRATDPAGNTDPSPGTRAFTVDTASPSVSITSPPSGSTFTSAQTVQIAAVGSPDTQRIEFYLDGQLAGTEDTDPFAFSWSVSSADNGSHAWSAKAFDEAGNASAPSDPVTLTVAISGGGDPGGDSITASAETDPVPHPGDAADDPAIWLHPTDTSRSTVIGTDKLGGLAVYDLSGHELFYYADTKPNNVDLRYNFPLAGNRVALVATSDNSATKQMRLYSVDPATRGLEHVSARTIPTGVAAGLCMYRSPVSGDYHAFIGDNSGTVQQWRLFENAGKVDAVKVRTIRLSSTTEGCVADDETGDVYISEEDVGIWKYGAEPTDPATTDARDKVDGLASAGGHLTNDIEGLAIYYRNDGQGYLLASSQGSDDYVVYSRTGNNAFVTRFRVGDGTVDGISKTDGIDVTNFPAGDGFPGGMFVAQDNTNTNPAANQDFKLVPWERIARDTTPELDLDTSWDPRHTRQPSSPSAQALHSTATEPFVDEAGGARRLDGFNVTPVWSDKPGETWGQSRYDQIRDRGFNAVRFVLKWSDFEPTRGTFDAADLVTLDTAISRAKAAGLYVILDAIHLYGEDGFDYVPVWARTGDSVTSVQTNGADYLKLLAGRYRSEPAVAAYDPVNEFYRWPIDQNGVLRAYDHLIREIRTVDPDKIVIVEPTFGDTSVAGALADFSNLTDKRNVVWSIHDYFAGGDDDGYAADGSKTGNYVFGGTRGYPAPNPEQLERHLLVHLDKTREAGMPMWIGEYGIGDGVANHDQWIRDKVALFDKYGLGRAWWEYRTTAPMSATAADGSWKPWVDLIAPSPSTETPVAAAAGASP